MKTIEKQRTQNPNEPDEFKIEKNIPIPARLNSGRKYPFAEMDSGNSFIISNQYSRELMNKYASAARAWRFKSHNYNWRFAVRKTDKYEIRIYRLNDYIPNNPQT